MILGIDLGSNVTKNSKRIIIESKVSKVESLSKSDVLIIDGTTYFLGEGDYDTTYRKVEKENLMQLLFGSLALTTIDTFNYLACGLPISQYKEDKSELQHKILSNREKYISINNIEKKIVIEDVEVFPEGIAAMDNEFEGIVVDIGGRTTDTCLIERVNGKRKVVNAQSIPTGVQNLYSDFIKVINNKKGLDLKDKDAERILKNGLRIYGEHVDITFAIDVFKEFVEGLKNKLQIEYSLKTYDLALLGGGGELLYNSIKKRIPNAFLVEDSFYANAIAYEQLGRGIWEWKYQ